MIFLLLLLLLEGPFGLLLASNNEWNFVLFFFLNLSSSHEPFEMFGKLFSLWNRSVHLCCMEGGLDFAISYLSFVFAKEPFCESFCTN
jgi:hypothetical protein